MSQDQSAPQGPVDFGKTGIGRRELLVGAAALVAASASGTASAAAHDEHATHAKNAQHSAKNAALVAAALDCVGKAEACIAHCLASFQAGDTSLADCMARVHEMHVTCQALSTLAVSDSKHLAKFAAVCAEICKSCEDACREHEKMHASCRACAESCATCIEECNKLSA